MGTKHAKPAGFLTGFGWMKPIGKLEILFTVLWHTGKIDGEGLGYDQFLKHFIGGAIGKIIWYGTANELVWLIHDLMREKVISQHGDYIVMICDHFCKPDGGAFNRKILGAQKGQGKNESIETFVNHVLESLSEDSKKIS